MEGHQWKRVRQNASNNGDHATPRILAPDCRQRPTAIGPDADDWTQPRRSIHCAAVQAVGSHNADVVHTDNS